MTIKQLGGVFGRNPTFNDVTIEGELTFDGDIDVNSDLKVDGDLEVTGTSYLDGYVGIGVDPAATGLHLQGADNVSSSFTIKNSANDNTWRLQSQYNALQLRIFGQGSEVAQFDASNNFNLIGGGNIIVNSGQGIDFSATAGGPGTVESELFNDYEEGYYTATTTPGSGSLTTSYDRLNYTKVGRSCTVSGEIVVSSVSTPGSGLTVSLPFAAASGSERSQRTHFWVFLGSLTGSPTGVASGYIANAGGTTFDIVIYDDFASVSNTASFLQVGSTIRVGFTYQTA